MKNSFILNVLTLLTIGVLIAGCSRQTTAEETDDTVVSPSRVTETSLTVTSTSELRVPTTKSPTMIPTLKVETTHNEIIAFSTGSPNGIFTISPNDGTLTELITRNPGIVIFGVPSWSPLGDKIVFYLDDNGKQNLFIMKSDGTNFEAIPRYKAVGYGNPAWSPDGEHIVYSTTKENYILDADGIQKIITIDENRALVYPAWSPDGEHIAFLSREPGDEDKGLRIFIVGKTGGKAVSLTDAIARHNRISWSPDGRKILFSEGCGYISVVDISSGQITQLTTQSSYGDSDPAWSPDGKYIAFVRDLHNDTCNFNTIDKGDLFIMSADGKELKQLTKSQWVRTPSWWPLVLMQSGWKYEVTKAGANLNVRESPSQTATSLTKLPQGEIFTALDGPVKADNYDWWLIRTEDGIEGWIVDVPGWYMLESAP